MLIMMKHAKSFYLPLPKGEKKRWKELACWLLFWADGIITLSGISLTSPAWSSIAGLIILLTTLMLIAMASLVQSVKDQELKPLIDLIKEPGEKKKWLVLSIFFILIVSTICFSRFMFDRPLLGKVFLTGLGGFTAVFLAEWLTKPSQNVR